MKAALGDYVWTNEDSEYVLCRITSEWKDRPDTDDPTDEWSRHDIHNYREAEWRVIDPAFVPGYVKRYFASPQTRPMARPRGGQTPSAKAYAAELHATDPEQISEVVALDRLADQIDMCSVKTVFNVLDPVETEDLVIDYLQSKGWHVVKSSTSPSQPGIECVLRRVDDEPETAYVQVKSGETDVDIDEYTEFTDSATVYLHHRGTPKQSLPSGIEWVSATDLKAYMAANPGYLPPDTALKLSIALPE